MHLASPRKSFAFSFVTACAFVVAFAAGCPSPSGEGEGEGEGAVGEGEGAVGEGEGEGAVGEGEGEGSTGEGEGEGGGVEDGSCFNPFVAVIGDNAGLLADGASRTEGSCSPEDGPEQAWSYTTTADNVVVRGKVHTTSSFIDVDLYARSDCTASSKAFELGCSANFGDDEVEFTIGSAGTEVTFVVDSFTQFPAGTPPQSYTLTVDELTPIAHGQPCDPLSTTSTCVAPDQCANGTCGGITPPPPGLCSNVTPLPPNGSAPVAPQFTTELSCAPSGGGEHAFSYTTAFQTSDLTVSVTGGIPAEVELRTDCATPAPQACASLSAPIHVVDLPPATTIVLVVHVAGPGDQLAVVEVPHPLNPGDPCDPFIDVCPSPTQCLGQPGAETCTTPVTLHAGDPCTPNDAAHVCPSPTSCLGTAGATTCTQVATLNAGDACDANDSAHVCPSSTQCVAGATGARQCIDTAAATCSDAVTATLGHNAGDTSASFDGFAGSCSFPDAPEEAFTYTVQGAGVKLVADVHGAFSGADDPFAVFIDSGACNAGGSELACSASDPFTPSGDVSASARGLFAGDVVTIFVEDPNAGRFDLDLTELPIVVLNPGDTCTPGSDTATCPQSTPCLGGPSPRAFTCTAATVGENANDACLSGSTDQTCDVAHQLFCENDVCVVNNGATSGSFNGSITAADSQTSQRPNGQGNVCANPPATQPSHYDEFHVENATSSPATITFDTDTNCVSDTILVFYAPAFDPGHVSNACVNGNDDDPNGHFCSSVTVTLAAQSSGDVVLWTFFDQLPSPYTLHYSSNEPVIVTPE